MVSLPSPLAYPSSLLPPCLRSQEKKTIVTPPVEEDVLTSVLIYPYTHLIFAQKKNPLLFFFVALVPPPLAYFLLLQLCLTSSLQPSPPHKLMNINFSLSLSRLLLPLLFTYYHTYANTFRYIMYVGNTPLPSPPPKKKSIPPYSTSILN